MPNVGKNKCPSNVQVMSVVCSKEVVMALYFFQERITKKVHLRVAIV